MPDRLAEIRARLDAATPGPWVYPEDDLTRIQASDGVSVAVITRRIDDADLIAHAPADIAWLLDEVEQLRESLDIEREWSGGSRAAELRHAPHSYRCRCQECNEVAQ